MRLLSAKNLSKTYYLQKDNICILALSNVNFEIQKGEFISIVGPSGCGKSTLLKLIAGFEQKSSGVLLFDDKEIKIPHSERNYIPQDSGLFRWLNVLENVKLAINKKEDKQKNAFECLDKIGLKKFAKAYIDELSGGMKQRVALARALAMESKLILLDEPFSALDEVSREKIDNELLKFFAQNEMTTILVTHSIKEAIILSDRIFVMDANPGHILKTLQVKKEKNSSYKEELYEEILSLFKNSFTF
ncbi:MAG: ABC transporter ATP-binding protein [Sulfurospirillum sp.]|nr:ABC transporter ATP-binding protein [Sulfurospirillum sp.]